MRVNPDDVEAIRRQMAKIRRKHHERVRELLAGAEEVVELERYVRPIKWAAAGAAAATACWIVTKWRSTAQAGQASLSDAVDGRGEIAKDAAQDSEALRIGEYLFGNAWSLMIGTAVRAAQYYAAHRLEQWIANQRMAMAARHGALPSCCESDRRNGRRVPFEREASTRNAQPLSMGSEGSDDG